MKLEKITQNTAETIIVYGKDSGFTMLKIKDIPLTIYHREYKNKHYDIAEMNTNTNKYNEHNEPIVVTTFYILDPKEVSQLCN